jgi:hypothetical protein
VSTSVLAGQLTLAIFLGVCVALEPGTVLKWNEAGLSNYGVHPVTVIPYSLAFAGCGAFTFVAAQRVRGVSTVGLRLRALLSVYGVLNVLALLSTYGYTSHASIKQVHMVVGIVVMVFEPLSAVWLYRHLERDWHNRAWLGAQMLGLVLGAVDFAALLHILFLAQLFTGVSFGVLLVRGSRAIEVTFEI